MRTRSPALSDSTSSSLSGGLTSVKPSDAMVITVAAPLAPHYPHPGPLPGRERERGPSQRDFLVAMRVALDGDGHGQARDVARVAQHVHTEGRGIAAVSLRTDAEAVGVAEDFLLDRVQGRVGIGRAQLTEERLLGQDGRLLEIAAHTHSGDERRTGIGPRRRG